MVSSETARRAYPDGSSISFWAAPDGWQLRRFDWPSAAVAPRGSILFQGGRGDIFEKYLEAFHHWHDQGWAITSFDWRGQGGSGRLTDDPHVGDIDRFGTYLADYGAFWHDWTAATPGPHVAMGHSMGGHLVCRAMAKMLAEPDAAILIAPMMGLHAPISARFGERVADIAMKLGNPQRRAWKSNEKPGATETRLSLLTHDPERYSDEPWWWDQKPEIKLGPPSWRWVVRAFESTRRLRASKRVKLVRIPVLVIVAEADKLVRAADAIKVAGLLPDARLVRFGKESAHEILREVDPVRNRALGEIDIFLSARAQQ
jgi:lysophospholipase